MVVPNLATPTTEAEASGPASLEKLRETIEHAAHLLPAQGPITVFVHHNTLHAFEHLPFAEGVETGAKLFGCEPYLLEERYRQELERGRILVDDLRAVLKEELGERARDRVAGLASRLELRLAMLEHPLPLAARDELRWFVAETDALRRFRRETPPGVREQMVQETRHWVMRDVRAASGSDRGGRGHRHRRVWLAALLEHFGESRIEDWADATWETLTLHMLWRVCREGVHGAGARVPPPSAVVRHRDVLLESCGEDTDLKVHDLLIRFCAAFLDQGFSHWPLPERNQGFFRAFLELYGQPAGPPDAWLRGLPRELARVKAAALPPLESIRESLEQLGVSPQEWDGYLTATLLALRGWAGMIRQMEVRADRVALAAPEGSLLEFLAIRLLLERCALADEARRQGWELQDLNRRRTAPRKVKGTEASIDQRAFQLFQLAQVLGWLPPLLDRLPKKDWAALVAEVEAFSGLERRRRFHEAFERRYLVQTLDAITIRGGRPAARASRVRFQVVTCIDEREESFRRHLEELEPQAQTWSAAGFFNVAMYYRGAEEATFTPLCPIVIRPQHWVTEDVVYTLDEAHRRRTRTRRVLGNAWHQFHVASRSFAAGALLSGGTGALFSLPLVARVLFPRLTSRIRRKAGQFVQPPAATRLELERGESAAGPEPGRQGFTVEERANITERTLQDIGLTSGFARLVIIMGHGSNSLNNPHKSAYDCGACGGGAGGPNARALARMANDPRVRDVLLQRGLAIPADVVFLGAFHNTCNDSLIYYDLDYLPKSHQADYEYAARILEQVCERNAHERCRRFQSAPLTLTFAQARRHVEGRAEDLAQTRPECGHATNALCVVGRRERTRGLFLDRRAFLVSYDPLQDAPDQRILTRLLQAVVPVCAGINLEYYFSYVDPPGWGCGTKLPHNVSALLGIMDGAASDLRPGLPWQMVEIHEPVRLLFIVETTPEIMRRILDRNEVLARLCRHEWVRLATLAPDSPDMHLFRHGDFEPYRLQRPQLPSVPSSCDWYRGWREHLGFALIQPSHPGAPGS